MIELDTILLTFLKGITMDQLHYLFTALIRKIDYY